MTGLPMSAGRRAGTDRSGLALRPGWGAAGAGVALASVCTIMIATTESELRWLTARLPIAGLVALVLGAVVGSARLAGIASLPMLLGALLSVDRVDGPDWGRSLIIGSLWYVALELVWSSIEQRDGVERSPAVIRLRRREVAQVVIGSIGVGLVGALLATIAPARTLFVRGIAVGAVLVALGLALGRLSADRPADDRDPEHDRQEDGEAQP